jgi:hypothetical protein
LVGYYLELVLTLIKVTAALWTLKFAESMSWPKSLQLLHGFNDQSKFILILQADRAVFKSTAYYMSQFSADKNVNETG